MNENPKNFFDKVKFAMRDGTVTLIPLGDLGIKLIFEFKRNPNRYLTNTGELEINIIYIGSPTAVKQYVFAAVKSLSNVDFSLAMEKSFKVLTPSGIIISGFYLLFMILVLILKVVVFA